MGCGLLEGAPRISYHDIRRRLQLVQHLELWLVRVRQYKNRMSFHRTSMVQDERATGLSSCPDPHGSLTSQTSDTYNTSPHTFLHDRVSHRSNESNVAKGC